MPKVTGPLFSLSASGTFRNALEFRTANGNTVVTGTRTAPRSRSAAQQQQSERFRIAVQAWQGLDANAKAAWKTAAANTGMNGYQLYLSEYQTQSIEPPNQPVAP